MKHLSWIALVLLINTAMLGKKVKFSVDMTGQTISPNGVHVVGDFQQAAGLGPDWDPGAALLTKEGSTDIYSLIVNIPAFKKYEYKFINGNQTYESEFVPDESRVGYVGSDLIDNRWIYIDSLANDTTKIGNILFAANAPAGKILLRLKVDMTGNGNVSTNGIHVGTSVQSTNYDPSSLRLYSFGYNVYEIIQYVNAGTIGYMFYNGNVSSAGETVPSGCAVNGKRSVTLNKDTVLPSLCFSSCQACVGASISKNSMNSLSVYPNPASQFITVNSQGNGLLTISDLNGKSILNQSITDLQTVDISSLASGIYILRVNQHVSKLIIE